LKRWHEERDLMLRRWRLEIAEHERWDKGYPHMYLAPLPPDSCDVDKCHCYRGPGYFRKRHPFDCGNTRCGLCHWGKWDGGRRSREKRAWRKDWGVI
jgi:hypothetical protein